MVQAHSVKQSFGRLAAVTAFALSLLASVSIGFAPKAHADSSTHYVHYPWSSAVFSYVPDALGQRYYLPAYVSGAAWAALPNPKPAIETVNWIPYSSLRRDLTSPNDIFVKVDTNTSPLPNDAKTWHKLTYDQFIATGHTGDYIGNSTVGYKQQVGSPDIYQVQPCSLKRLAHKMTLTEYLIEGSPQPKQYITTVNEKACF